MRGSPVSVDSLTWRETASSRTPSAGTSSPVFRMTISPTTTSRRGNSRIAAADDLDHGVVIDLVQDFKLLVGAYLEGEPHAVASRMAARMPAGSRKTLAGSVPVKNW